MKFEVLEKKEIFQKPQSFKERKKEKIKEPGLCLTCNRSLFCFYQRIQVQPVLFCEEFDGDVAIINKAPLKIHLDSAQVEKSLGKYKGL